jgi:hypothetical protein
LKLTTDFEFLYNSLVRYQEKTNNKTCLKLIEFISQKMVPGIEALKVMISFEKLAIKPQPPKQLDEGLRRGFTPSGRPSQYRYTYSTGEQINARDRVTYMGKEYNLICGAGGDHYDDPMIIIRANGGDDVKIFSSEVALLSRPQFTTNENK